MTVTAEHVKLAKAAAVRFARAHRGQAWHLLDDLKSVALMGLAQAAAAFDPARDVKFSTFAWYRINGALVDFIRVECAGARRMRPEKRQELRERFRRRLGNDRGESTQEQYVELRWLAKRLARLKPVQRDLVERLAAGETLEAVGAEHGITKSWASRLWNAALEELAA